MKPALKTSTDRPLSRAQLRKIWSMKSALDRMSGGQFDEDALRDIIERKSGQRSTKELTFEQAKGVIDELVKMAGGDPQADRRDYSKSRRRKMTSGGNEGPVTIWQLRQMESIANDLGWKAESVKKFSARQCGSETPRTVRDAQKIIEGMKAILRRRTE